MTREEYDENWMPFHRTLFGMKSEDDLPMFAAWFRPLSEFSLYELRDASMAMAEDIEASGKFRTQHLAILRSKIQSRRFERARAEFAELNRHQERFECQVCGGSGLVPVPHVRCIVDDAWQYPFVTMVVACRCPRGSARFNAVAAADVKQKSPGCDGRVQMMGLDEYEALHPNWRRFIQIREELRESERNAEWHAKRADEVNPIKPVDVREAIKSIGSMPK